uniref:Phosphatidylethanolamine-binding protein n=1 Tax=Cuerna arida TaxID=1464854 RepID=A0A1B6EX03_9HEMI
MDKLGLVPDVIDTLPGEIIQVTYEGKYKVDEGKELTPTQVKNVPEVKFPADPQQWYTLLMTDPDAPTRANPTVGEVQHWLVTNIPGSDVTAGETIHEYIGSGPPQGTGLHRYIFLVYKQPGKLTFDEPRVTNRSRANRLNFSTRNFVAKYKLEGPIAANVYQAQFDDYVPILHQQLSG